MKKFKKVFSIILAVLMFLNIIPAEIIFANTISINKSYVSAMRIREVIDGLTPYDENNSPGNDSGPSNGIVRSFDNINYTIEYTTELKENTPIDEAYLMIEFKLPCTKDIATFNMDTMAWIVDEKLVEKDGFQILTGKRLLQNAGGSTAIPGHGILSTGINIHAAPNGTVIQPTFKLWMEGNSEDEIKSTNSEKTVVSAALKYNIEVKNNSGMNFISHYDFVAGDTTLYPNENSHYGRAKGYAINLQLNNDYPAKGLKGLAIPSGDITFDITIKSDVNGIEHTFDPDFGVRLWDYNMNNAGYVGKLNRNMSIGRSEPFAYTGPGYKGGWEDNCYDSGDIKLVQDPYAKNVFHATVKDYKFHPEFEFPIRYKWSNSGDIFFGKNIGTFAAEYVQLISLLPTKVSQLSTVYQDIEVSNIHMQTKEGQTGIEMNIHDNKQRNEITLYPEGWVSKYQQITKGFNDNYLASDYYAGDNAAYKGNNLCIRGMIFGTTEEVYTDFNYLQKFDDEAYDPTGDWAAYSHAYNNEGKRTILWAAKPDKSGWNNDREMNWAKEEDLIYFEDLNLLKSEGYTCVGILFELRDFKSIPASSQAVFWELFCNFDVKQSAKTNNTYQIVSELRCFKENISDTNFSWKNIPNGNHYGFGTGRLPQEYTQNHIDVQTNDNYGKVYYQDGAQYGHQGGYIYGNSLLILDYKSRITAEITDKSFDDTEKNTYDLDANERIVNYKINPETVIESTNSTPNISTKTKTNVKIRINLPKDLKYNQGSATITPDEHNKKADGSSELVWYYKDVFVGINYDPIAFSCTIGKPGTTEDVVNNQQITMIAEIMGDGDSRETTLRNENEAHKMFNVIKLNALSIAKETDTPFIGLGQIFNYNFKFANNSPNKIENAKLYDVLPFVGDGRNTNFSGEYRINSITADFTHAPKSFAQFKARDDAMKYTTDKTAQNNSFAVIDSFTNWTTATNKSVNDAAKTITYTGLPEGIVALLVNTDLEGIEYIDIKLSMVGTGQKQGDVYVNSIFQNADGQIKEVNSNRVAVQVAGGLTITKIWKDDSNSQLTRPDKIDITLYQNGNVYRKVRLTGQGDIWTHTIPNAPLYDIQGNKYTYTIKEDEDNINLKLYYKEPVYNQTILTVINRATFVPDVMNEFVGYKIIVKKDILNNKGSLATKEDFNKVKLNINDTYNFPITLKELKRTVTNTGTGIIENYSGYSGKEFVGILTNKGDLIFNLGSRGYGKYEISESINQYFDFIDIEKVVDELNSPGATFTKENGKYYITLSGITGQYEQITVKVRNQLKPERPYNDREDKVNLFK